MTETNLPKWRLGPFLEHWSNRVTREWESSMTTLQTLNSLTILDTDMHKSYVWHLLHIRKGKKGCFLACSYSFVQNHHTRYRSFLYFPFLKRQTSLISILFSWNVHSLVLSVQIFTKQPAKMTAATQHIQNPPNRKECSVSFSFFQPVTLLQ